MSVKNSERGMGETLKELKLLPLPVLILPLRRKGAKKREVFLANLGALAS